MQPLFALFDAIWNSFMRKWGVPYLESFIIYLEEFQKKQERRMALSGQHIASPISTTMARYQNLVVFLCFVLLITKSQSVPTCKGPFTCHLCENYVSQGQEIFERSGAAEVTVRVKAVCEFMGKWRDDCFAEFLPIVDTAIKGFEAKQTPHNICKSINYC
uniref:Saposin B-type domain-containing protein n=1 Tax=Panagrellus redivivus TaxID=6233 RepID=A0A7E4VJD6_PANRE